MEAGIRVGDLQAKECQGWAATPEAKRKAWKLILPWSFQSQHWPCQHLDFGLPTFRIMREYNSIVLNHSVCGTFLTVASENTRGSLCVLTHWEKGLFL